METTITFNRHLGIAECCTADPSIMRRWQRAGWTVAVLGRYPDGKPRTWQTTVPWTKAVRFGRQKAITDPAGNARSVSETPL